MAATGVPCIRGHGPLLVDSAKASLRARPSPECRGQKGGIQLDSGPLMPGLTRHMGTQLGSLE
jgi:hypothetical protein